MTVKSRKERLISWVHGLPRPAKKMLMIMADLFLIPLSLWIALSLRLGVVYKDFDNSFLLFIAVPFFTIPIFAHLGLYRAVMRYVGQAAIQQIFTGVLISAGIVLALTLHNWPNGLPRSAFAIYGFVAFGLIGAVRLFARILIGGGIEWRGQRVAIYGAGASGRQLVSMLSDGHEYRPVLFLDDDKQLIGREVKGLRVYNPSESSLEQRLKRFGVTAIFLAMPSVSGSVRRKLLKKIEPMPFHVYTVPGLREIVSGAAMVSQVREVSIEDILGRDPVAPNIDLLGLCITNKTVLVTGAGGSIGAELCRQILALNPKTLILLENSEFALFNIEKELRRASEIAGQSVEIVSILGSVCDRTRVEKLFEAHAVDTVYHAAAYKHVPIVEHNPIVGITNNVFGTKIVAEAALRFNVKHFVLISTDKAVRPTNIMGASKRIGELILQNLASDSKTTKFCMVRFGNVLNSSGSVLPLFRQQIKQGGPVTVTHPEVTRYFMTIPEAVQLVIQAGAMAKGGDVFILDMGEPVKIYDLARQVIKLSGLEVKDANNPDGDIEIVFTGLRPGEKLYEELLIGGVVSGTEHASILRAEENKLSVEKLQKLLRDMDVAIQAYDLEKIKVLLVEAVAGYLPHVNATDKDSIGAQSNVRPLSEKLGAIS